MKIVVPLKFIVIQNSLRKKHYGFIWLEGWKSRLIKNGGRMEKWKDKEDFNLSHFCLVGSEKVEGWKK